MRKLFEVYLMNDEPLTSDLQRDFDRLVATTTPAADVVIAADFGHGLIGPSTINTLTSTSRFLAVNTQSNSANIGYNLITKYPRADYICIDAPEARLAVSDRLSTVGDIAHTLVHDRVPCPNIIITQGKHGCSTYARGGIVHTIPALARRVVDTIGAGDAFLAVTAPLVAAGGALDRIGFIGNAVGALKVEIVGHRQAIDKASLVKAVTALLK
jgi:sugar/nucleoside kinase (ribokinase family)